MQKVLVAVWKGNRSSARICEQTQGREYWTHEFQNASRLCKNGPPDEWRDICRPRRKQPRDVHTDDKRLWHTLAVPMRVNEGRECLFSQHLAWYCAQCSEDVMCCLLTERFW